MRSQVELGGELTSFEIIRSKRKTLEIAVHPDMSLVVRAPLEAAMEAILGRVKKKADWIKKQQCYFLQFQPRTPERQYLAGETFLYLGRQYRLKVEVGAGKSVKLIKGYFVVSFPVRATREEIKQAFAKWYRTKAKKLFAERLQINLDRFSELREAQIRLFIRKMKTRWGSLSKEGVLTLNLELIRAPKECLDYVIIHELCHIIVPDHSSHFYSILEQKLPEWSKHKELLEIKLS